MTALIDRFTVSTITRQFTDFVVAYLIVLITYGGEISGAGDVVALAQVILVIKLPRRHNMMDVKILVPFLVGRSW